MDDMSSDAIEGERTHLESTLIFSLSMPAPNIKFEPIFQPILDPYDSSYDPRNPCRPQGRSRRASSMAKEH
jgi:hypothetical protein